MEELREVYDLNEVLLLGVIKGILKGFKIFI